MGLFNYVNFKTNCPNCNKELTSFQSKDGEMLLTTLEITQVNKFYTICECRTWIEYERANGFNASISSELKYLLQAVINCDNMNSLDGIKVKVWKYLRGDLFNPINDFKCTHYKLAPIKLNEEDQDN